MIDFKKYKRFFAFGCSMTRYGWPTWADCIGNEIKEYHNYGQQGGGNMFIACQVAEANTRYNFTSDDLVMIMWSTTCREDRYMNMSWQTPGNIYSQGLYSDEFVEKYSDGRGQLIRDLSLIQLTKGLMDSTKADYHMLAMAPIIGMPSPYRDTDPSCDDVMSLYSDVLRTIKPDLLTAGCNGTWPRLPIRHPTSPGQTEDYHPRPKIHLSYLNTIFPGIVWSKDTIEFINREDSIVMLHRMTTDLEYMTHYSPRL